MNQKLENITTDVVWDVLTRVADPEIPVLSVTDLGIIRNVAIEENNIIITITPTYAGCPAMDMIAMNIRVAMIAHGFDNVIIRQQLSPAWTTEWMSDEGKEKLKDYGIAPPLPKQQVCSDELFAEQAVACPRCNSFHTKRVSEFGSTPCKSLYVCDDCHEPFDYFKCH